LNSLSEQGVILITGQGKSTLYRFRQVADVTTEITTRSGIFLSVKGRETQELIHVPADQRPPRVYDPGFLRRYDPNSSFYLTVEERSRLLDLGQTAQLNQPAGTYARQILQRLLIDLYTITSLHALLSNNLLPDPAASGRLRKFPVGIGRSAYKPPSIPQQIEGYFNLMLDKASQIKDPFEQAFFIMVQLPYLQPFEDVNKWVSRLAANIPLNKHNLAPLSFVDVPQDLYVQGLLAVYEFTRIDLLKDVFMWAYERSAQRYAQVRQTLGEPDPFRLRYRDHIRTLVSEIVNNGLAQAEAQEQIVAYAEQQLPDIDRTRFIEVVETELLSLHDGNFARYRILPSKFVSWEQVWKD